MGLLLGKKKKQKQGKENFRKEILVIGATEKSRNIMTWERTLHLDYGENNFTNSKKGKDYIERDLYFCKHNVE